MSNMKKEFMDFLKKFSVVGMAIGIVSGGAVKSFVDAMVASLIQPLVNRLLQLINLGSGANIGINLGGGQYIAVGDFLVALINFLAVMWVVFMMGKFFLNKFFPEETVAA